MKKIAFSFIFLCICSLAVAQIDPMVEVNRAYETRLNDKTKPIMPVRISDSLGHFDIGFDYSIFDRPYTDLYEFSPYQAAELQKVESERFSYLSVKAGAQVPFIPSLAIYGQLIPSSNVNLGITGVYDSHIGKVTNLIGNKMNTSRTNAGVGLNAKFAWKSGELDLAGGYNIAKASDGPAANELVVKHNVDKINASFRITSANPTTNSFYYNASLEFNRTGKSMNEYELPQYNYKESQLDAAARFGATFGDYRLYVDFKNRTIWPAQGINVGFLEFTPILDMRWKGVTAKLGLKIASEYGPEEATKIYPDVEFKAELVKHALWIRLGAKGGTDMESFSDYALQLPWLVMQGDRPKFSAEQINAKLSLESLLFSRLALNVSGNFVMHKNKMLLYPYLATDNPFSSETAVPSGIYYVTPAYADYNRLSFRAEASWTSRDFNLSGAVQYNKYTKRQDEDIYMLPALEAMAKAEYNWRKRFYAGIEFNYTSKRVYRDMTSPVYADLGLRLSYRINRYISVYIKGGNLLCRNNFIVGFIPAAPLNVGGGISITL